MSIFNFLRKHSTIFMPVLSIVGVLLPTLSNAILPWLPSILFFLMFFTLLGIDQRALFEKLRFPRVWIFAVLQNIICCILIAILTYAMGVRGDLLLAIVAVGATAPLFGSGAIVNAMGFDALIAMAKTIIATLIMPFTLFTVLYFFADEGAFLDLVEYTKRLIIYIICPIILSVIARRIIPQNKLQYYYPKVAQFNVLLVLAFPLGLMGGYRQTFDNNANQALWLLLIAVLLTVFSFLFIYILYRKADKQQAVIASTVCSGRNVLLTYTIAMPFLGSMFLPLIGALQIPMYAIPFFAKLMLNSNKR